MIWEKRLLSFPQTHTFDFYMKTTFHFQSMCKWFWLGWSLNQHNFEHSLVVNVLSNLRMISFRKVLILGSFLHLCSLLLNIEQRQILFQSSFLHLPLLRFASHLTDQLQIQSEYSQIFPLLLDCPSSPTSSNRIMHCLWTLCECVAKSARREGPTQDEQRAVLCDSAFERGKNRVALKVKCGRHLQLQRQAPSRKENPGRWEKTVAQCQSLVLRIKHQYSIEHSRAV